MEKIQWKTEKRKVSELIPADYNPRIITEKEKKDLMESITIYGEVEPLVINTNNKLIGGHQRSTIYADLGIEEIEVRVPSRELTIEEEMRLNLRLNKNTGGWDKQKLGKMGVDMLLEVGWNNDELSDVWNERETTDDNFDEEKELEKAKTTTIKAGDLYQLGEHRLMCGNSRNEEDVKRLAEGSEIGMIYCDPPYNIGLNYSKGIGNNTSGKYQGEFSGKDDSKEDGDYRAFLSDTIGNAMTVAKEDTHVFYWCDERYIHLLQSLFEEHGVTNKRVCLWIKNGMVPTPQVAFSKAYEPCVYGVVGRPFLNGNYKAFNEILNKETGTGNALADDILGLINLWLVDRDSSKEYKHPTQKPTKLHEKPIKRCTAPGGGILDLFGGSGSTLIAAEMLKRKAYLMEKDPIFCQVILNRYEQWTGEKAKKIEKASQ